MLKIITQEGETPEENISLDDLAREGARRMIQAALEVEVDEYINRLKNERDENGRAMVVRNGKAKSRRVTVGSGTVDIQAPRVHDKREGYKYLSRILPPYIRRSPNVNSILPVLYLRGLSTGDFVPALSELLGEDAAGLSSSSISRLVDQFAEEYQAFRQTDLSEKEYVYIWADGVHFNIRLEEDRLAVLVIVGVTADGRKEVIALEDGYRESKESWLTVLRDLKRRGMTSPRLAVADGALGFWNALSEVFPESERQQCWVHKIANVLDKLPKRLQARAKAQLHEIMNAPTEKDAQEEKIKFIEEYEAKYPKATASLERDWEFLITLYHYPAKHWIHLRTTNPIESTFSTVKLRTRVTRGAGSRRAGLAMAYKLLMMAQENWRAINAPELVKDVLNNRQFIDGVLVITKPKKEEKMVAA
jgi:transposase-like protein